jgi:AraC-like DNA-binding protein
MAVEDVLRKEAIPFLKVLTGEIYLAKEIDDTKRESLRKSLSEIGLELIDNRGTGLIEKIKKFVIRKARNEEPEEDKKLNLSNYLNSHLHHEYTYLSSLFSSVEGRTIENYYIEQRIEKAKELIVYRQMTLSEIAYELNYSSVAHLSNQFKKITGLTPSHFRDIGQAKRKPIDSV